MPSLQPVSLETGLLSNSLILGGARKKLEQPCGVTHLAQVIHEILDEALELLVLDNSITVLRRSGNCWLA